MEKVKPVIYQMFPRIFANRNENCVPNGTIEENGSGKMNDITLRVLESIRGLGATHVWYTGVIEHAQKTDYSAYGITPDNPHIVKGNAGSPYAIKDYYDIDPDIACNIHDRMTEFESLVERTHRAGLKVVIDFVPNHTARHYHSDAAPAGIKDFGADDDTTLYFGPNNNYYYIPRQLFVPTIDLGEGNDAYIEFPAKATGNDCFSASPGKDDWYETVKLNYGIDHGDRSTHFVPIPDTWFKMLNILRFWASKGVDAFRCDMVFMVPLEFWEWAIPNVKERYPHVQFIAEIYDVSLYRDFIFKGGFDYLYDKVNLYDTLRAIQTSTTSAARITNCWQTIEGIGDHILNFLENHDEQRFASQQYAADPMKVFPSLAVSAFLGTGAMMIYYGQELGEPGNEAEGFSGNDGRTTIFDYWSLSTIRRWLNGGKADGGLLSPRELSLRNKYGIILNLCNSERAITEGRFFDLMYVNYDNDTFNPHRQYAFLRSYADETLLIAVNFSDKAAHARINIPRHAFDTLDLKPSTAMATELISGAHALKQFSPDTPFETTIGPWDAVVWKINDRNIEKKSKKTAVKTKQQRKK